MAEPRADRIAEAMVDALRGVSRGAGDYTDLGQRVSRVRWLEQEIPQTGPPTVSVFRVEQDVAPEQVTGRYRDRMIFAVEVWYRAAKRDEVERDGVRIVADVRKAVLTDPTLGLSGVVVQTLPWKVTAAAQQFADNLRGWELVGFAVDYQWTVADL